MSSPSLSLEFVWAHSARPCEPSTIQLELDLNQLDGQLGAGREDFILTTLDHDLIELHSLTPTAGPHHCDHLENTIQ